MLDEGGDERGKREGLVPSLKPFKTGWETDGLAVRRRGFDKAKGKVASACSDLI